MCNVGTGQ